MFSTARRDSAPAGALTAGYSLSQVSSEGQTSSARIDAAIKAAMAVDSQRGAATFNHINLTPQASTNSYSASADWAGGGGEGGGALAVIPGMDMAPPMSAQPQVRRDSWSRDSGNSHVSGSGGGAYKSYQSSAAGGGIPGGIAGGGGSGNGAVYRNTTRAVPQTDDSLGSASAGHRSGSVGDSDSSGRRFVPSAGGSGGERSGNGDAYGGAAYGGAAYDDSGSGGVAKHIDGNGHKRRGVNGSGSGGGGGSGGVQQPTRPTWVRGGGAPTPKAVWQQEAQAMIVPVSGESAEGFSSGGSSGEIAHRAGSRQQSQNDEYHAHTEDSSGALAPPAWVSCTGESRVPGELTPECLLGLTRIATRVPNSDQCQGLDVPQESQIPNPFMYVYSILFYPCTLLLAPMIRLLNCSRSYVIFVYMSLAYICVGGCRYTGVFSCVLLGDGNSSSVVSKRMLAFFASTCFLLGHYLYYCCTARCACPLSNLSVVPPPPPDHATHDAPPLATSPAVLFGGDGDCDGGFGT